VAAREKQHDPDEPVSQEQHQEVLDTLREHGRMHLTIVEKLTRMEERLRRHYEEEHRDFATVLEWARGGRVAAKILAIMIGLIGGAAAAYAWVTGHFNITPRS
jgi:hypothetical protein